jgi:anti-sigma B factor antagonist
MADLEDRPPSAREPTPTWSASSGWHHSDLTVERADERGRAVLRLSGDVDQATAPRLEHQLGGVAREGVDVVIDLREVGFIDSSGLRALVQCERTTRAAGAELTLTNLPNRTRRLLELTGLAGLFSIGA